MEILLLLLFPLFPKAGWLLAFQLTTSPSLAKADKSVCGASLCLSIPSRTKTSFSHPLLSLVLDARHSPSNTASELTCSHLPFPSLSQSSFKSKASRAPHRIFVSRCRPVMHSELRTMVCGIARWESTPRTMVDLHVPEMPCTTTAAGLGMSGFRVELLSANQTVLPPMAQLTVSVLWTGLHG